MKIIKNGVLPAGYMPIRFTCSVCGCVFEASNEEYETQMLISHNDKYYQASFTKCPYCGSFCSDEFEKEKKR